MGFLNNLFGKKNSHSRDDAPFMEHPTGQFDNALQAICSAMKRLDRMDMGDRWIEFCAQGQGAAPELTQCESIQFNNRTFSLSDQNVDLKPILDSAGLTQKIGSVQTSHDGKITLPDATPEQLAVFLDTLFRKHFGIKPFEDEGDYAVGAEW